MTRGQRNNNPLNIRRSADKWQGERVEQTDKEFVEFTSMECGCRAAWKVLESYWEHFRKASEPFTVANIIRRWAPPNENDTVAYIRTVLTLTSLGGQENLQQPSRASDKERLVNLLSAMTTMECGIPYDKVDREAIYRGWVLAFGKKRIDN